MGGCIVAGGGDRAGCGCSTPRNLCFSGPAQQTPEGRLISSIHVFASRSSGSLTAAREALRLFTPARQARCCRCTRR